MTQPPTLRDLREARAARRRKAASDFHLFLLISASGVLLGIFGAVNKPAPPAPHDVPPGVAPVEVLPPATPTQSLYEEK
jgi:hypothetical protein